MDAENECLVIFVRGGNVVFWYKQPRQTVELGDLANANGYSRSEALFVVDRSDPGRPALKPAQSHSTTSPASKPTSARDGGC